MRMQGGVLAFCDLSELDVTSEYKTMSMDERCPKQVRVFCSRQEWRDGADACLVATSSLDGLLRSVIATFGREKCAACARQSTRAQQYKQYRQAAVGALKNLNLKQEGNLLRANFGTLAYLRASQGRLARHSHGGRSRAHHERRDSSHGLLCAGRSNVQRHAAEMISWRAISPRVDV